MKCHTVCGKLDHTENFCDVVFDSADGVVEKGWGPKLRVTGLRQGEQPSNPVKGDGGRRGTDPGDHGPQGGQGRYFGNRKNCGILIAGSNGMETPINHGNHQEYKALTINPMFDAENFENEEGNDYDAFEQKKRNRMETMHAGTLANANRLQGIESNENQMEEEETNASEEENYFLTATPGCWASRV